MFYILYFIFILFVSFVLFFPCLTMHLMASRSSEHSVTCFISFSFLTKYIKILYKDGDALQKTFIHSHEEKDIRHLTINYNAEDGLQEAKWTLGIFTGHCKASQTIPI